MDDTVARPAARMAAWSAVAFGAAFAAWVVLPHDPSRSREIVSDLAPLPAGLAAWVAAWWASRRPGTDPATSRAWRRIAVAFLFWWLGDVVWFAQEVLLSRPPFPSVADAFYLLSYPMLAAGMLSLPGAPRRRAERIRVALDALTVLLAAAMVVWYLIVGPSIRLGGGRVATLLAVAYPVGDLVLLFGVAVVLLGRQGRDRSLWLLLGGVGAFVVADVAYARLSLSGAYNGGDWPDACWVGAQVLFVSAAIQQSRPSRAGFSAGKMTEGISKLPYAAVVLAYSLLFAVGRGQATYPLNGLLIGAGAITAVVMARQIRVAAENARLLDRLHHLASIDGLTSILNRRSFLEAGELLVAQAAATLGTLAVLMIDVDHFKTVNDTFGHATGDEVLVEVAVRTKLQLRESDIVGRYGGDELAVMMPGCGVEEGVEVAERIRHAVAASPVVSTDGRVDVSLSVGVAEIAACDDVAATLARADGALYRAKGAGRGCTRAAA